MLLILGWNYRGFQGELLRLLCLDCCRIRKSKLTGKLGLGKVVPAVSSTSFIILGVLSRILFTGGGFRKGGNFITSSCMSWKAFRVLTYSTYKTPCLLWHCGHWMTERFNSDSQRCKQLTQTYSWPLTVRLVISAFWLSRGLIVISTSALRALAILSTNSQEGTAPPFSIRAIELCWVWSILARSCWVIFRIFLSSAMPEAIWETKGTVFFTFLLRHQCKILWISYSNTWYTIK